MQKLARILKIAVIIVIVASGPLWLRSAQGGAASPNTSSPAWSSPSFKALKRVSSVNAHQSVPVYFTNLDCTLETYRLVSGSTMRTGCFSDTAFGQIDTDSNIVIFNGTDEGLSLQPYSAHEVLVPWNKALVLVALDTTNTGGSYISLYKNPLGTLQNQRNYLGQLTAKHLTAAPELVLKDAAGHPLIVNSQTMAYSDNGAWLVVEVVGGSFVRINLATLQMTPFTPGYGKQASSQTQNSDVAVSADGRFIAIENGDARDFKVFDLSQCSNRVCASYNYQPFVQQQISGLRSVSHVRFINRGILTFDATASYSAAAGTYEIAPTAGISSLIDYLGLGDSFSSGEGAYNYLAGTDDKADVCHQSSKSYPLLLTHDLFTSSGGHSVACSGAVIHDIYNSSDGYKGPVRGVADWQSLNRDQPALLASITANYLPGYVAQHRFMSLYQPRIATVGVGGNNMGFANILEQCVELHASLHVIRQTCFATYEDRQELLASIRHTGTGLRKLYQQLQSTDPSGGLYVIGYPQIAVDTGRCGLNVHFNVSELEFVHELIDAINSTISSAAVGAGAKYVDISKALVGHRLCETAGSGIAVNGLTAGTDSGIGEFNFLGAESYHPNALGQQLIEATILKQTNNLRSVPPPTIPVTALRLGDAPVSGRPIKTYIPSVRLTKGTARAGQMINIMIDPTAVGLPINGQYVVHLDGGEGSIIGNSDTKGNAVGTIPTDTVSGVHVIDAIGLNQDGKQVDISQPIYVSDPATSNAGCGVIPISGQDSDEDGIDDTCDPVIGEAPTAGSSSGTVPDPVLDETPNAPAPDAPSTVLTNQPSSSVQASVDTSSFLQDSTITLATPSRRLVVAKSLPHTGQRSVLGAATTRSVASLAVKPVSGLTPSQKVVYEALPKINWLAWLIAILATLVMIKILDKWLKSYDAQSRSPP